MDAYAEHWDVFKTTNTFIPLLISWLLKLQVTEGGVDKILKIYNWLKSTEIIS